MEEERDGIAGLIDRIKASGGGSLLERIDELRARLVKVSIVVVAFFCICFGFAKYVFAWLKQPLMLAMPKEVNVLHFTGPMEVLTAYMKVSMLVAITMALPMLFFQLWKYIAPALPEQTRKMVLPFFTASLVLFVGGIVFCYYLMMPAALEFLIGMGDGLATAVIMVDEYISMIVIMLLGFGGVFQLPVILIILERLGIISEDMLKKNRGPILVAILIVAAIVTPTPDPFSQLFMAAPMYLMFEAAILIIKWLKRRDQKALQVTPSSKST